MILIYDLRNWGNLMNLTLSPTGEIVLVPITLDWWY